MVDLYGGVDDYYIPPGSDIIGSPTPPTPVLPVFPPFFPFLPYVPPGGGTPPPGSDQPGTPSPGTPTPGTPETPGGGGGGQVPISEILQSLPKNVNVPDMMATSPVQLSPLMPLEISQGQPNNLLASLPQPNRSGGAQYGAPLSLPGPGQRGGVGGVPGGGGMQVRSDATNARAPIQGNREEPGNQPISAKDNPPILRAQAAQMDRPPLAPPRPTVAPVPMAAPLRGGMPMPPFPPSPPPVSGGNPANKPNPALSVGDLKRRYQTGAIPPDVMNKVMGSPNPVEAYNKYLEGQAGLDGSPEDNKALDKEIKKVQAVSSKAPNNGLGYGTQHKITSADPRKIAPEAAAATQQKQADLKGVVDWLRDNPSPEIKQQRDWQFYRDNFARQAAAKRNLPLSQKLMHPSQFLRTGPQAAMDRLTPEQKAGMAIQGKAYKDFLEKYSTQRKDMLDRYGKLTKELGDEAIQREKDTRDAMEKQADVQNQQTAEYRNDLLKRLPLMQPGPEKQKLMEQNRNFLPADPDAYNAMLWNYDAKAAKKQDMELAKMESDAQTAQQRQQLNAQKIEMNGMTIAKRKQIDQLDVNIAKQREKLNALQLKNIPARELRAQADQVARMEKQKFDMQKEVDKMDLAIARMGLAEEQLNVTKYMAGYTPQLAAEQKLPETATQEDKDKAGQDAVKQDKQGTLIRGSLLNRAIQSNSARRKALTNGR